MSGDERDSVTVCGYGAGDGGLDMGLALDPGGGDGDRVGDSDSSATGFLVQLQTTNSDEVTVTFLEFNHSEQFLRVTVSSKS